MPQNSRARRSPKRKPTPASFVKGENSTVRSKQNYNELQYIQEFGGKDEERLPKLQFLFLKRELKKIQKLVKSLSLKIRRRDEKIESLLHLLRMNLKGSKTDEDIDSFVAMKDIFYLSDRTV